MTSWGLVTGVRWTSMFAFYGARHYAAGEDSGQNPNTPMHRIGPVVAYSFWKDRGGVFDNPTAVLLSAWWLEHRYRSDGGATQALPLVALAFQFTGDLLPALTRQSRPGGG
jgi:hypothetical protein